MSVAARGSRGGPALLFRTPAEAAGILEGWRNLAAGCGGISYFGTPDWVLAWWETLGRGVEAEVALWTDASGAPEAVAAMAQMRERLHPRAPFRVRMWTNLGSGPGAADHCGWPVLPHRAGDVRLWVGAKSVHGAVLLSSLDPHTGIPYVPPGARRVERSACPRVDIGSGEEFGRSPSFRKKIRAYQRRLARDGVTFRWVPPERMTDPLLDVVFDLHERRRRFKGGPTTFEPSRRSLHRRLIRRSAPGRGPTLVLASVDGEPVGALYGFLWRDVFAYYQSGWDPDWASASLGTVLIVEAMRLAALAGARVFDFLRGAEEYKYRFGAKDRIDETWLVPNRSSGRLLSLKYRSRARVRSRQNRREVPNTTVSET